MTKHKHPSSAAHPHPNHEATQRPPRNLRSDIIRESESWVGQRHHSSLSTNHDNPGRFCRALWLDTGHRAELCVGVCVWEHAHVCAKRAHRHYLPSFHSMKQTEVPWGRQGCIRSNPTVVPCTDYAKSRNHLWYCHHQEYPSRPNLTAWAGKSGAERWESSLAALPVHCLTLHYILGLK